MGKYKDCRHCGVQIQVDEEICPSCKGLQQTINPSTSPIEEQKNASATGTETTSSSTTPSPSTSPPEGQKSVNENGISKKRKPVIILIAVIVLIAIVIVAVPLVEVEQEKVWGKISDETLEGGHYRYWVYQLPVGTDIELNISASDTLDLFILTKKQFDDLDKGGASIPVNNEKKLLKVNNGILRYHVSSTGTYYFVLGNPHDGFLGFGAKNVGIFSASVTSHWQERVSLLNSLINTP